MSNFVAVLLYPGCIYFEVALALETLGEHVETRCYSPDGAAVRSSGVTIAADGTFSDLLATRPHALLIPGGDPGSVLVPVDVVGPVVRHAMHCGALVAGICAGNLVIAASGALVGRRGTHNYTAEHASPEAVAATAPFWEGMRFERADLVQDGQLITAQPWAYRHYAAAVATSLGVLTHDDGEKLVSYPARRRYNAG